ncbi:MAG: hypothetical protein P9M07_04830 [Candidatus Aceula meridiana]|nr:hypothetical protein [Candidatus Aceula meridiana]
MFRKAIYMVFIVAVLLFNSGCVILSAAMAAGAAYGISQIGK